MLELNLKESYVIDADGRRIGVLLSLSAYNELKTRLEELEAFRTANDISVVKEIHTAEGFGSSDSSLSSIPSFRPRRGPGGMIVI